MGIIDVLKDFPGMIIKPGILENIFHVKNWGWVYNIDKGCLYNKLSDEGLLAHFNQCPPVVWTKDHDGPMPYKDLEDWIKRTGHRIYFYWGSIKYESGKWSCYDRYDYLINIMNEEEVIQLIKDMNT